MRVASRITRVTLEQDQTIESGSTITVFGFIVANSTTCPAEVDIQDGDGTKKITIVVPPVDSKIVEIEWIADNGLVIDGIGSASVYVTIFHTSPGA